MKVLYDKNGDKYLRLVDLYQMADEFRSNAITAFEEGFEGRDLRTELRLLADIVTAIRNRTKHREPEG